MHAHSASFLNQKCEKSVSDAKKNGSQKFRRSEMTKNFANFVFNMTPSTIILRKSDQIHLRRTLCKNMSGKYVQVHSYA